MDDWLEICDLKYRYCYRLDSLDEDGFVKLFTPDASFDITTAASGRGHKELREFIRTIRDKKIDVLTHIPTNPRIDISETTATGKWYYLVLIGREDGSTELGQGYYNEEYRQVDSEWRIASVEAKRRYTMELS